MITFKPGKSDTDKPIAKPPVGRSIVLYGPPFSGKTSSLQYDPSLRYAVLDFDKNTSVIEHMENVDIFGIGDWEEFLAVKEGIEKGTLNLGGQAIPMNYDVYVIDSFTSMEEKIKAWVVNVYAPNRSREIKGKFGAQTDWADCFNSSLGILKQ